MKTTAISIKIEPRVKKEAQKVVEELGMSLSTFVNAALKQVIRTKEAHFTVGHRMTLYLEKVIEEAERDYRAGNYAGPFSTIEEMDAHLDSL